MVCAGAALLPSSAAAHALLLSARPAPGAQVATSPAQISATFTEPLNHQLSTVTLAGPNGKPILTRTLPATGQRIVTQPLVLLRRAVYNVRWHSVSADDGHTLDGSYEFGVQAAAPAGERQAQRATLAGGGWLRALLRTIFYAALIVFCGGVFNSALLASGRPPGSWLTVDSRSPHGPASARASTLWRRTVAVGWVAVAAAVLTALVEAADAAGRLSGAGLRAFLFSDVAGEARVAVIAALLCAVGLAARSLPRAASATALLALASVVVSGHADSAHPRGIAVGADLLHLAAAAVWVGGIALVAWAWLPRVPALDGDGRRIVMERVLAPFARVALPAFATVVAAGALNATLELGSIPALWEDAYGRVLAVKIALVASIAAASYSHALRIRPRLLRANPSLDVEQERRHWRLMSVEPVLGIGVIAAAGLLAAFTPAHELVTATQASPRVGSTPAPAARFIGQLAPGALSVAEEGGPLIVAAVVRKEKGGVEAQMHTLSANERPVEVPTQLLLPARLSSCGVGCRAARVPGAPAILPVRVIAAGKPYIAHLPIHWQPDGDALAQRLLARVKRGQLALRDVQIHETLRSGPSARYITDYRLRAPDRFAFTLRRGAQPVGSTIIVRSSEWQRAAGESRWSKSEYGGGAAPFAATSYLGWWIAYAANPRLLDRREAGGFRVADIATLSVIPDFGAVWLRLRIDVTHHRLLRLRMITDAHFMTQEWRAFNRPLQIQPPAASATGAGSAAG
jgi:copper transport protein